MEGYYKSCLNELRTSLTVLVVAESAKTKRGGDANFQSSVAFALHRIEPGFTIP